MKLIVNDKYNLIVGCYWRLFFNEYMPILNNNKNVPVPEHIRKVSNIPEISYFKPSGVPISELEEVSLSFEELEAIRLTGLEGLYQESAAEKMGISRQTKIIKEIIK